MSWTKALALLIDLEGGCVQSNPPEGTTFAGVLQSYYEKWCAQHGRDKTWPPTQEAIASYYYDEYWVAASCSSFPEPADAVALQLVVNLPYERGRQLLQIALGVFPDGVIGPKTLAATKYLPAMDLADRILMAQEAHYCDVRPVGDADFKGLFNRTQKVRAALAA